MPPFRIALKRILYSMLIGLAFGVIFNEVTFLFLRETARPPEVIELVIPAGTAERVARGEASPSIPASMTFVVGDTLVVQNNDTVGHVLGSLWIPSGTSASLSLEVAASQIYDCSFQPENYFGLDVREPLTLGTRLYGILFSGLPLGGLIALYSLIMPVKKKNDSPENV
jgi:hypothetical protein